MTSTTTRSRPPRRLAVIGGALAIYLGTTALFVVFASSMLGASRGAGGALFGERVAIVELEGDRKSTRLNSSHGYISYAVFCLKKKKKFVTLTTAFLTSAVR